VKDLSKHRGELSQKQERDFQIIQKLYEQQKAMYEQKTNQIEDWIVSISRPHIRLIVGERPVHKQSLGQK
jgi:IS5 family transposase